MCPIIFLIYLPDLLPPTRTQAYVNLNKKPAETTQPDFPSKAKPKRKKKYNPKVWEKNSSSGTSYKKEKKKERKKRKKGRRKFFNGKKIA